MIRKVNIDGEDWFAAIDVAAVAGFSNSSRAVASCCRINGVRRAYLPDAGQGNRRQEMIVIDSLNTGRMILRGSSPFAEQVQEQVVAGIVPDVIAEIVAAQAQKEQLPEDGLFSF